MNGGTGNGYPRGLTGENIPLEGRIVAVCDVFDALATDRPYHPRLSPHVALGIVCANAGLQFDPDIVDAFARCFPRVLDLYESEVPSGATLRLRRPSAVDSDDNRAAHSAQSLCQKRN